MKTSGLFTIHTVAVPQTYSQEFQLIIFGDVHRDSKNHADGKWQEDLAYFRSQKNSWFLGMGDYLDSTSTSERECLGNISNKMHETYRNDVLKLMDAKVEMMAGELKFMKGRLLGLINGNHYFEFPDGTNSDQRLCRELDCKYLGVCSFIRLRFYISGTHKTLDVFAHHGMGAARLVGGSINRVLQMFEGCEADITVMGHDHKRIAAPATPRMYLDNDSKLGLKIKQRECWAVRSGSYVAAYRPGETNYNVDACRLPASLGYIEMRVKFSHVHKAEEQIRHEIKFIT